MISILVSLPREGGGSYLSALEGSGAQPVAGFCPAPDLNCAGLLLTGGGDLDWTLFAPQNLGSQPPDLERDQAELVLCRAFLSAGKPILGICRGMQLLNVALGGDLIQDLPLEVRPFHSREGQDLVHPIRCAMDSFLFPLYGPLFPVNSIHHQAVNRLGTGLRAAAWSESGVVEALELPGRPVLGVQFHPERMAFGRRRGDTVDGAPLFAYFLSLCRGAV